MAESGGLTDSQDLDCNDNSPRLTHFYTQSDAAQANPSPLHVTHAAPATYCGAANPTPSDDNTHGQMALPARVTYSAEDTLNNDFFYDDEFTVPFDATLVELQGEESGSGGGEEGGSSGEAGLLDSTELDAIIKNRGSCRKKLLKSNLRRYQGDVEASSSSELGDHQMSQELTQSERDIVSSSDMSDLQNGLVFSPPSGSLNEASGTSEMNGSFLKNGHKYDFDWKATKDRYTISFDKQLAKYSSDESSFCDSTGPPESNKVLTTWATQKSQSDSDSQSTSTSSRKSSDSGEKACDKKQYAISKGTKPNKLDKQTSGGGECSSLTTWKAVRSPSHTSDEDVSPIASWKCFKGHSPSHAEAQDGEKSSEASADRLKFLRQKSIGKSTESGQSGSSDYKTCSEGDKVRTPESNGERKTSLLELFQRSKSQSGTDTSETSEQRYGLSPCEPVRVVICDEHESLVSPDAMRRLTGTWSMSTISSGRRSHCAALLSPDTEAVPPNISLKSWGTACNLKDLSGNEPVYLSESDVSVSGHSAHSDVSNGSSDKAYMPTCNCDLSGCLDCSGQVGSGYLTDSYSMDKLNQSSQWPPCTCSAGIQTSIQEDSSGGKSSGKFPAVDISSQTPPSVKNDKPYNSRVSRLYSIPAVRHSPKHARDRLAQSLFSTSRSALPDLSFLNSHSKVTESGVLRATMSSPNLKNTKSCQTSITEHLSPTGLARRIHKRSVSTSPCSSRESSPCTTTTTLRRPRSNSLSTNASACSSSSSGIDPGYSSCDSQINKVAHWFADVPEHLLPQIPEWLVHRIAFTEHGLCLVCRAKLLQASNSHKNSIDSVNSSQANNGPSQASREKSKAASDEQHHQVARSKEGAPVASNGVKLRPKGNNGSTGEKTGERPMSVPDMQTLYEEPSLKRRPLKSCLRRSNGDKARVALKHRSWSDPFDATVLRYSQDGETRYQLVTVPSKPCMTGEVDNQLRGCAAARDSVEFHKVCGKVAPAGGSNCVTKAKVTATGSSPCTNSSSSSQSDGSGETIIEGGVKISPDRINLPPCSCGTTHAVLHSSSDSGEGEQGRVLGKKSVKFAEKVFYHSPHNSPHQSPKRRVASVCCEVEEDGEKKASPLTKASLDRMQDEYKFPVSGPSCRVKDVSPGDSMSQSGSSSPSASLLIELDNIMAQKRGVVCEVIRACEIIHLQLREARDAAHLEELACTRDNPAVGETILKHLCPALVTMVTDGVKASTRSLFGKVKNTPWRLVEELIEQGAPSRVLCHLVRDLDNLAFLDTPALKFNAFIFGLLNHRALDFWLTYLCNHDKLITNNYLPTSFVALSQTSARNLFLELNSAIQPLSKVPFRLEYNFEYMIVKGSQSQELSAALLEKHTNSSTDAVLEHLLNIQEQQAKAESLQGGDKEAMVNSGTTGGKPVRDTASPLRESIQDTLKQYTPSIEQTKERTRSLLKYTGQQIKDKFKQIQRQSRSDGGCSPGEADGGLVTVAASATTRPKGSGPLRVPRYEEYKQAQTENNKTEDRQGEQAITTTSKDDTAIKTHNNTMRKDSIPRSQSLDTMPSGRNTTVMNSNLQDSQKQSSLTDLVNFVGKKLFSFTNSSPVVPPPKPPRTYRDDATRYSFDHSDIGVSMASSSSESCLSNITSVGDQKRQNVGVDHRPSSEAGGIVGNETLLKSHSLSSLQQSTTSSCSSAPPNDFQVPGSNTTSVTSSTQSVPYSQDGKAAQTARILSPSTSMKAEDQSKPSQSISKTANFFRRKLGPTLINVFDKLLLDKKPTEGMKKTQSQMVIGSPPAQRAEVATAGVKRSVSEHEMPKRSLQALCSYVATESEELSFQKGSVLSLVREVDSEWLMCEHKQSKGLVHKGCVQGM